jgi:hypothetical protein
MPKTPLPPSLRLGGAAADVNKSGTEHRFIKASPPKSQDTPDLAARGLQLAFARVQTLPAETGFDYGSLAPEIRSEAKIVADEIKRLVRGAIIEVGAALLKIQLRLPHGQFGKWLSAEFAMTERTARNYMAAAELVSKSETVSVLRPKTLYLLASPSTPEPVKQAVIERFNSGERLPDRAIRELISEVKSRQKMAAFTAVIAKREKRTRRNRAQRHAEWWARQAREREEIRERNLAAAEEAAALILETVVDRRARLGELIKNLDYDGVQALITTLRRALSEGAS